MASNEHKEGFEIFLKEKADSYKMYPSEKVWTNLHNQLHPRQKWPYLAMAVIFLGLGFGGKIYDSRYNTQNQALAKPMQSPGQNAVLGNQVAQDRKQAVVIDLFSSRVKAKANKKGTTDLQRAGEQNGFLEKPTRTYVSPVESGDLESSVKVKISSLFPDGTEAQHLRVVHNSLDAGGINTEMVEPRNGDNNALTSGNTGMGQRTNSAKAPIDNKDWSVKTGSAIISVNQSQDNDLQNGKPIINQQKSGINYSPYDNTNSELQQAASPATQSGSANSAAANAKAIKVKKPGQHRLGWQLYLSPMVSYRNLYGTVNKNSYSNLMLFRSLPGRPDDINSAVSQSPSVGMELGTAMVYNVSKRLRLKGGLQVNYSQYNINAYNYSAEIAPLNAAGVGHTEIKAISYHRNFDGYSEAHLKNEHFSISVPLGAELMVIGNKNVAFNIGGTLQPGLMLNNQAYMLSTNLKNYAKVPSLYRSFNVNTALEAFITVKMGSLRWNVGPQFRYQLLSSYKQNYPLKEHLYDYGFKVGLTKILR